MSNILTRNGSHCKQGNVMRSAVSMHSGDVHHIARRANASETAYAKLAPALAVAKADVARSRAELAEHITTCQACADAS